MASIAGIPEPPSAHNDAAGQGDAPVVPLSMGGHSAEPEPAAHANAKPLGHDASDAPDQQIDSVFCLMLLLVAAGLLRVVLGLLGPIQAGVPIERLDQLANQSAALMQGQPTDAYPLYELLAGAVVSAGLPGWIVLILGALLTFGAVPAAYVVGRVTTGRHAPGLLAAAVVAVHPAVLTASISLSASACALALVTLGLALVCLTPKRGGGAAVGGGLLLGLAGLAAPLCWLVGLAAGPLVTRLLFQEKPAKAIALGLLTTLLAIGPVFAYRAAFFGVQAQHLLPEFVQHDELVDLPAPVGRLLVTLTDPSLAEMGDALSLPLGDAGRLTFDHTPANATGQRDIVADTLADAWLLMNTALAGLAALSVGVMLWRRRIIETLVLACPVAALAFAALPPGEMARLPLLTLIGVLSMGLFARRVVVELDEQALAERAAKKAAKDAAKEEKARAKEERRSQREMNKVRDFQSTIEKAEKKNRAKAQKNKNASEASTITGVLSERPADESSIPMRPI